MNKFVAVKKSKISGRGLFALKDFKKGEAIYGFKKGRIIKRSDIMSLSKFDKMHVNKIGADKYEIIEPPACFINHSCEPNIIERKRIGYALKNIKAGAEITIDYNKISYFEKPFPCFCLSKKCKKSVYGLENKNYVVRGAVSGEEIKIK